MLKVNWVSLMMSRTKRDFFSRIVLILLTIGLALLQEFSLNKVFVLDENSLIKLKAISDSTSHDGLSTASYSVIDNKMVLSCTIVKSKYPWPFCEVVFEFYDANVIHKRLGIDLSSFDRVKIFAQYENFDATGIRFTIRSYNALYSTAADKESWKFNSIEY